MSEPTPPTDMTASVSATGTAPRAAGDTDDTPSGSDSAATIAATPPHVGDSEVAQPQVGRRASRRAGGSGAMSVRLPDDIAAPQREVLERVAIEARATGRRFDLMRYLRLRRKQTKR